jgi:hypothetical protein
MGYTVSGLPFVGPVRGPEAPKESKLDPKFEGQWISAGYTGHGMPRAFGWYDFSHMALETRLMMLPVRRRYPV